MIAKLWSVYSGRVPLSEKNKRDVSWNIASMVFCGLAGLAVIIIVSKYYGAEILGLFNLTYAIYVFLSQLAVGGVHFSVLKYAAQYADDKIQLSTIFMSGLLLTILASFVIGALALIFRGSIARLFNKPELEQMLWYAIPGLIFFSLNKLHLSFFNARRDMKRYAIFQALRYFFLLGALLFLALTSVEGVKIPIIFSISEILLYAVVFIFSFQSIRYGIGRIKKSWIREHFIHGIKAAIGNLFIESNARADIIILGLFSTSKNVGIYSLAANVVDGFGQISNVFRSIINPIITTQKFMKGEEELGSLVRKGRKYLYQFIIPAGIILLIIFPIIIAVSSLDREFYKSIVPFSILLAGSLASVGYRPFIMIPNQTGFPGHQSFLFFLVFLTNVIGNILFISLFGMTGAAIGTAMSFISSVFYLKWIVRKTLDLKI